MSQVLTYEALKAFCEEAFVRFGFSLAESEQITDVLLASDLYGIDSHGTNRIVMYHNQIRGGLIDIDARPSVVFETPVSAVIDGKKGMGQLVSIQAMEKAIELAKKSGIGLVTVRNSNHFGIAGYYTRMASDQGLLGVAMTNSLKAVVPTFGRLPMLGTNPIAFTFPGSPAPFHFDASTSVVTAGKIEVYSKLGKAVPQGWGMNGDGEDETDADKILESMFGGQSGLHPLGGGGETYGGHKGYGFSMIAEILSSVISMGTTSNHVEENGVAGVCHFFCAVDPAIFGDAAAIQAHLAAYLEEVRQSPKAKGQERIYIHGEKAAEAYAARQKSGITVNDKVLEEMKDLAADLEMDLAKYFPGL